LTGTGQTYESVVNEMKSWTDNPQSEGFISLEHETTDQAVNAFKEYASELKSKGWNVTNIADLQDLPWYQNQYGPDDPVIEVQSILPTIPAIDVNDSAAAAGSSGAPDTSAFRSALLGGGSSSSPSSASSSTPTSASSSSTSNRSSTTTTSRAPTGTSQANSDTSAASHSSVSSFNLVIGISTLIAFFMV